MAPPPLSLLHTPPALPTGFANGVAAEDTGSSSGQWSVRARSRARPSAGFGRLDCCRSCHRVMTFSYLPLSRNRWSYQCRGMIRSQESPTRCLAVSDPVRVLILVVYYIQYQRTLGSRRFAAHVSLVSCLPLFFSSYFTAWHSSQLGEKVPQPGSANMGPYNVAAWHRSPVSLLRGRCSALHAKYRTPTNTIFHTFPFVRYGYS